MHLTPIELAQDELLYEQVALRLKGLITGGTLKPGDRLPSVRKLREQLSVSTSTVLEAYRLLEDQGLILVRPQSGYYVKQTASQLFQEPSTTAPPLQAQEIDLTLTFQVNSTMRDPSMIQLGAAFPGMEHLPLAQLNRLMGKILRENSVLAHSYGSLTGCEELRSELAKRMLDAGCSIAPDQILITNGTNEAFHLCLQAIAQPGDTIAVESPTYFSVLEAMKTLQLKALTIPTHPREGISLTHLEDAFQTGKVKACLLVSNFSNPLGCCMSDVKKKQLVELLNQYNVLLIEDDVYGDIYFGSARPKAVKAFDTEDRVLYCSSVSKTLSPGMRTGWCSGGRYHARIAKLRSVMNFGTSLILQLTVAAFLANGGYDRHLRHLRRVYQHQINRMQQAIYDYFPVETCVSRPEGGHVLWLELPVAFDAVQLYQSALKHRIGIAPGVMFSASGKCYKNCFRLNTTASWTPEIDQAMQTLGHLSKKQLAEHLLRSTNR